MLPCKQHDKLDEKLDKLIAGQARTEKWQAAHDAALHEKEKHSPLAKTFALGLGVATPLCALAWALFGS